MKLTNLDLKILEDLVNNIAKYVKDLLINQINNLLILKIIILSKYIYNYLERLKKKNKDKNKKNNKERESRVNVTFF